MFLLNTPSNLQDQEKSQMKNVIIFIISHKTKTGTPDGIDFSRQKKKETNVQRNPVL